MPSRLSRRYRLPRSVWRMRAASATLPDARQRSDLYLCMSDRVDIQQRAYLYLLRTRAMRVLCRDSGLDFDKAFPKPDGFDAFVEASKKKQQAERPDRIIPD